MSFDIYVFDMADVPRGEDEIGELLEDGIDDDGPLTERLAALIAELEGAFPGLDDDPDNSPWSSWPLTQASNHGRAVGFNVRWSMAEPMLADMTARCQRLGLTVFDPQTGTLADPPPDAPANAERERRGLFKRRK